MKYVLNLNVVVASIAVLAGGGTALAQGGAPAPNFDEPCPAMYPGDDAQRERIARWMARSAADRGLPHELPVMAAIAESGLRNIRGVTYHGFFGMHRSLNAGEYRGFPRKPELQAKWFLDTAILVRQRRVAVGRADPAAHPGSFGEWIADVERPAPQNRAGYQPHLSEARRLVAGRCAPPVATDTEPPRLVARIAARQRPLTAGGIMLSVRCPDGDCLVGATATVGARTARTDAREPLPRGRTILTVTVPRAARRELRAGRNVRATVSALAADAAANRTSRSRSVLLQP
jgi:hypothetical protein